MLPYTDEEIDWLSAGADADVAVAPTPANDDRPPRGSLGRVEIVPDLSVDRP